MPTNNIHAKQNLSLYEPFYMRKSATAVCVLVRDLHHKTRQVYSIQLVAQISGEFTCEGLTQDMDFFKFFNFFQIEQKLRHLRIISVNHPNNQKAV